MPKRKLRIVRRVKYIPVLGVCEFCNMQFPVHQPPGEQAEAQAAIQQQFDAHKCEREDVSQAAARTVREATEKTNPFQRQSRAAVAADIPSRMPS